MPNRKLAWMSSWFLFRSSARPAYELPDFLFLTLKHMRNAPIQDLSTSNNGHIFMVLSQPRKSKKERVSNPDPPFGSPKAFASSRPFIKARISFPLLKSSTFKMNACFLFNKTFLLSQKFKF